MSKNLPVVLITGASRGLGRGIAIESARRGFSAVVSYARDRSAALETVSLCEANRLSRGQKFVPIRADLGVFSDAKKLVAASLKAFGRIDALVNNAGMAPRVRNDITEMTQASYDEVMNVNLRGPFFLTQHVVNYWLAKKPKPLIPSGFKIVFVSSISALTASLNRGEYCISKAGLGMVNKLWALRLAAENIQVYELRPGVMATDMTSGVKEKYEKRMANGLVPMNRWGTAEDAGKAVGALLAGDFPFSTGEVIYADGGLHIERL